jgi:zinc protease
MTRPLQRSAAAALVALAAWLAAPAALAGTPGVDEPPEPLPPRPVSVPPVSDQRLPNGLRVVVVPRADVPLVTATLLVRAGPEADPPGRAGLADMTATLLTKGAQRGGRAVGASELAVQAEALGSSLASGSGWRSSNVAMTVTVPKLEAALALIADVVRRPTLAAAELDRARVQALDGLRVAFSEPGQVASFALRRAYWGDSALGAVATPQSLQRLSREDVQRFHRTWFRPDLAALVLAGDVTPEQGLALARRHFGDWRAPAGPVPRLTPAPAVPTAPPLVVVDMPGSGQSAVTVAAPFVATGAPDRRAAQVASAVLGTGYSSRLNREVRIRRGLSYGASAHFETHPTGGMLVAQAQTKPQTAGEVLDVVREEIVKLAREAPAADELAARQAVLTGGFARRLETTGGLAALVSSLITQDRPLDELQRYTPEILAVTPEQVRDVAARLWREGALRAVIAGDAKAGGDALKAADGRTLVVPLPQLDLERAGLTHAPK